VALTPASLASAWAYRRELSRDYRVLRVLLVVPLSVLFGKTRGARAARRLLFELSWRVTGAKTYSASGWPGRLFYRES